MKLTSQESKTIGKLQESICPECNIKKLMINNQGLIWCSGVYCRYGFTELKLFYWNKERNAKYNKIIDLYDKAEKIVASNISWEKKHDMIFSDEIYVKTSKLFEWYEAEIDDYEEDIIVFMSAFAKYIDKLE